MNVSITSYHCLTTAGPTAPQLYQALLSGKFQRDEKIRRIKDERTSLSSLERLTQRLLESFSNLNVHPVKPLGLVLASTKGIIEDYVWKPSERLREEDSLTPLLNNFLKAAHLSPKMSLCVSNACASTHAAFFVAHQWLKAGVVEEVLILATDEVGPFIEKGFRSLGALSPTFVRPFSADRDGLQLGEASSAFLLSTERKGIPLRAIALENEGYSVTRPSPSGMSMKNVCQTVVDLAGIPSAVIAHGTGTKANDAAEDKALYEVLGNKTWVTGTKWLTGHTLGASGAVDIIAGIESLKNGRIFSLGSTLETDPLFKSQFILNEGKTLSKDSTLLVTSLGFGGTNAALILGGST